MANKLLYRIALTMIKGVGDTLGRQLLQVIGDEEAIFTEKKRLLETIPGIGRVLAAEILHPDVLRKAEEEMIFVEKNKIIPYFITDENYPYRLKECEDAPMLLYFKGNADLNAPKVLSIVGTRHITEYGKDQTEKIIKELAFSYPGLLIISGLAYGVDVHAHRNALKFHLPTVGVLAHGLDRIYPPLHRKTAIDMLSSGGLLTDFPSKTNPDRPNFVKRNRIVAGLSDATVIIESAEKGGSLITADIAFSYSRDVYSFPGRATDERSAGCNALIRQNKAALITSASDLMEALGWDEEKKQKEGPCQGSFCFELSEDENRLISLLKEAEEMHINQLAVTLHMPVYQLSPILFELEIKGIIRNLPGGRYKLQQ